MMTQLDLFAARRPSAADAAELSHRLLTYLRNERGWRTREHVRQDIGLNDRECRAARQHSAGRIIFGQRGFSATECAHLNEITACANTLESQARAMLEEAVALRRMAHGRIG